MQLSETTHGRILNEEVPEEAAVDAMIATIIMPNRVDIAPMPEAFLVRAALMRESSRGDDLKTMLYMATNVRTREACVCSRRWRGCGQRQ